MKDKDVFKKILWLAICIILVILVVFYTDKVWTFLGWVIANTKTVLTAIALAFVINLPTRFFERILAPKNKPKNKEKIEKENNEKANEDKKDKSNMMGVEKKKCKRKGIRAISILLSIMSILFVIAILTTFIIPELIENIKGIVNNIPSYIDECKAFAFKQKDKFGVSDDVVNNIVTYTNSTLSELGLTLENIVTQTFKFTTEIATGIVNFIVSFILAIYMVADKERLGRILKKITYAFLPVNKADYVTKAAGVFNKTFSGFVSGQVIEAIILGVLCYIGMIIFRMEYSLIISICIGVSALIPIFGAFIGALPGVFILLMISPMKAVWFVIYIIVLQQLEGNIIYPKVVGNSIGISGFWVLVALLVGGSIGGIMGILIGIPTFAAIYILFREVVNDKLEASNIDVDNR